jgi:HK97 gp10 family phage protein
MPKLKSANTISATFGLNLHTTEAMANVGDALFAATQDIFAEITFTAAELSPVLDKATSERFPGENRESLRDSIRHTVTQHAEGVRAKVFTTSGYGGWLELGTVKTRAQPYIFPAFEQHIGKLPEATKERLEEIAGG